MLLTVGGGVYVGYLRYLAAQGCVVGLRGLGRCRPPDVHGGVHIHLEPRQYGGMLCGERGEHTSCIMAECGIVGEERRLPLGTVVRGGERQRRSCDP